MALYLSSDDLARVRAVQTALLSPLAVPDAEAWGQAVTAALCELFDTEAAFVMLPTAGHPIVARGLDSYLFEGVDYYLVSPNRTGEQSDDRLIPVVERERKRRGLGVMDYAVIDDILSGALDESPFYNEVEQACGISGLQGIYLPEREGEGMLAQAHAYQTGGRVNPFGDAGIEVSRLLVPAFEAGAMTLLRFDQQRAAFDALTEPMVVFDIGGQTLHRNAAFEEMLAHDPERVRVIDAAERLARALGAARSEGFGVRPERTVVTALGRYRLRGTLFPNGGPFGERPSVLVTAEPPPRPWPEKSDLRLRFRLTRREADVALRLAEGWTNAAIAEALFVSPHTARRHTERVMAKLGVSSRAQVAAVLLASD